MTNTDYWISGYDLTKYSPLEIFQPVVEYGADTLIINHAFEGHPYPQLTHIKHLCDQKNIKLICILGGVGDGKDAELAKEHYPGVEFVYWPTYWMFFATMCQGSQNHLLEQKPRLKNTSKYLFLAMNGQPHLHRCLSIDHMHKTGVALKGKFNWFTRAADPDKRVCEHNFQFKWFNEREMLLSDGWRLGSTSSFILPTEFDDSSLIYITESQWRFIYISEKTVQACLRRKPWLIVGGEGQNKFMEEQLGFKLLRDVFDYSFDDEEDVEQRVVKVVDQLNSFCNRSDCFYLETIPEINDIMVHNHKNVYKILQERLFFPDIVKKVLDTNDDRFNETKYLLTVKNLIYKN